MFLLLCLPSGCGHPFGSLVSFVTFDRKRRWPLEGFFLSLRPRSVPIFSWLPLRLRQRPGVCYVALPMVVRTLAVGPGVSYAS